MTQRCLFTHFFPSLLFFGGGRSFTEEALSSLAVLVSVGEF